MNMRKMVGIQWTYIVIASMASAASPDAVSDDFSEFDIERQSYDLVDGLD